MSELLHFSSYPGNPVRSRTHGDICDRNLPWVIMFTLAPSEANRRGKKSMQGLVFHCRTAVSWNTATAVTCTTTQRNRKLYHLFGNASKRSAIAKPSQKKNKCPPNPPLTKPACIHATILSLPLTPLSPLCTISSCNSIAVFRRNESGRLA